MKAYSRETQPLKRQRGASLIEYSLLVSLIAFICITSVTYIGRKVENKYWAVAEALDGGGTESGF